MSTNRFSTFLPLLPALLCLIFTGCDDAKKTDELPSAPQNGTRKVSAEFLWPDLAPGETSDSTGETQPPREGENPPITRLVNIKKPAMDIFLPKKSNGVGVLIIPGGGFAKVVPDKEGSEAAEWLNTLGITAFVLRHRTSEGKPADEPLWLRPLQDAERSMRIIRKRSHEWNLDSDQIGVLGFSAGGQISSVLITETGDEKRYESLDDTDEESFLPNFALLIYPWRTLDDSGSALIPEIRISEKTPPSFIVHTHDDRSSSEGSALLYIGMKRHGVPAELHIYQDGGHGYGMRPVEGSDIGSWIDRATDWLRRRELADSP